MDNHEAYRELGLKPSADDAQLKAAWRRLVSTWHPDRNPSREAAVRIQRINKAYDHLRRARHGADDSPPGPKTAPPSAQTATAQRVEHRHVKLSLEEALLGCVRPLKGSVEHDCQACAGQGRRVLAHACRGCGGSGKVQRAALFGWLWTQQPCEECQGDGRQHEPCAPCEASGKRTLKYRRSVRLPAGVRDGYVLTVPVAEQEGLALSLELQVELEPHPFFVLEGDVLHCEMPVDGYVWMANGWVEVPTPGGLQQLRLNRDALVYRLRGQGFPAQPRGPRGDYLIRVQPQFPDAPSPRQKALLDRLAEISIQDAEANPDSAMGQWSNRLKGWKAPR
jgi:molecular chaperone DnaJ